MLCDNTPEFQLKIFRTMQGNIFVISAASGTGKTTLIARLLQHHSDIRVSVSHTTRAPAPR